MKQGRTEKAVFAKLSTQKVELGLVEDFTKVFESAVKADSSIGNSLINALSRAENKYKSVINDYEKAVKIGDDALAAAKDLGVDLPSIVKNKIESSKAGIKEARGLISSINKLYSAF
tara:strand:+ start:102 stop:452 length:351 start_codon:yes stop_codon:yes gene_type:complete